MPDLTGTQTAQNLMAAFAGESQARNRYTFFASKAKKEGFIQIADVFLETADQEKEHAKRLFKLMTGSEQEITGAFPFGTVASTIENLKASAAGENFEHVSMYPDFAKAAEQEGFDDIAHIFMSIAVAEKQHEKRYLDLAANIENGKVFAKDEPVTWHCRNCGYLQDGAEAPEACPACAHGQPHFEVLGENW